MKKLIYLIACIAMTAISCGVTATLPIESPASTSRTSIDTFVPSAAPVPQRKVIVTASRSVNIREEATEHSPATGGYFYNGQTIWVVGCKDGFANVLVGWVRADYLGGICP